MKRRAPAYLGGAVLLTLAALFEGLIALGTPDLDYALCFMLAAILLAFLAGDVWRKWRFERGIERRFGK